MINMNEFLDKYAPLRKLNYYKLKLKTRLGFLKVLFFLGGEGVYLTPPFIFQEEVINISLCDC